MRMIIHFKQTYYTAKQFDAAVDALDKHLPSLKDYETVAEMSKIVAIKANNIPLAISHGNLILDSFSFVKPVTYLAMADAVPKMKGEPNAQLLDIALTAGSNAQQNTNSTAIIAVNDTCKIIDQYLTQLSADKSFSGGLLIIKDGKKIFSKGYGWANKESKTPFTPATLASMGSITKAFHWSFIVFLFIDKFCKTLGSICEV